MRHRGGRVHLRPPVPHPGVLPAAPRGPSGPADPRDRGRADPPAAVRPRLAPERGGGAAVPRPREAHASRRGRGPRGVPADPMGDRDPAAVPAPRRVPHGRLPTLTAIGPPEPYGG